jgi:hypothetical protein
MTEPRKVVPDTREDRLAALLIDAVRMMYPIAGGEREEWLDRVRRELLA